MVYSDIIGKGPIFPIVLEENEGGTFWGALDGDMDIMVSDISGAMAHELGSMIRQEDEGHRINELLEEPNGEVIRALSARFCSEYLNHIENRITPLVTQDIDVTQSQGSLAINISAKLTNGDTLPTISININK